MAHSWMSRHVRHPDYTMILSEVLAVHGFIQVSISLHLILTLTHLLIHTGKASIQPKSRSQCTPTNPTVKWAPLPKSRSSWPKNWSNTLRLFTLLRFECGFELYTYILPPGNETTTFGGNKPSSLNFQVENFLQLNITEILSVHHLIHL